jgi:hypothetical protein
VSNKEENEMAIHFHLMSEHYNSSNSKLTCYFCNKRIKRFNAYYFLNETSNKVYHSECKQKFELLNALSIAIRKRFTSVTDRSPVDEICNFIKNYLK